MIRQKGSMPTSPCQSLAIPFHATGIAAYLENKCTSERVQTTSEANF